ncbi:hypothetical protein MHYP_G00173160 [Metynnis hypsauchen]
MFSSSSLSVAVSSLGDYLGGPVSGDVNPSLTGLSSYLRTSAQLSEADLNVVKACISEDDEHPVREEVLEMVHTRGSEEAASSSV